MFGVGDLIFVTLIVTTLEEIFQLHNIFGIAMASNLKKLAHSMNRPSMHAMGYICLIFEICLYM